MLYVFEKTSKRGEGKRGREEGANRRDQRELRVQDFFGPSFLKTRF